MDPQLFHTLTISPARPQPLLSQEQYTGHLLSVQPPISRLSSRLLGRILFLASADVNFCADDSSVSRARTARLAAQVNRQWLAAALEHQAIWLGPVLSWYSRPEWLSVVLERSHPLPLDALIPPDAHHVALRMALKHLPRIRNLEFAVRTQDGWLDMEENLRQAQAPLLERFSFSVSLGFDRRKRLFRLTEPTNIFCGYAPNLHQLEVHNCPIDLTQKLYYGLRVLVVDKMQFVPVSHLLDVLRNMRQLEKLYISRAPENVISPSDFHASFPLPDPQVHMPHLKELVISAPISACADIFRNLTLRETCSLVLHCRNAHDGRDLRDILSRTKQILSSWSCEILTGRQSLDMGTTHIQFTVQGPEEGEAPSDENHPFVGLRVSWPKSGSSDVETLFTLFPEVASAFQNCKCAPDTLSLLADADVPFTIQPLLSRWLREINQVQAVEFQSHDAFTLYAPLLRPQNADAIISNTSMRGVLLPLLGDLIFMHVNFTVRQRLHWRKLLKILSFREKLERPILQLNFVKCVGEFDQNIYGRFGTMVKVDGEDLYGNSDDEDGEDSDYTVQGLSD
ncbi:hypothetical protein BDZ97DRAFT_1923824 [Flammula alnicola]|nr:hypothetical protein BDZ97DRAFT_1923824 [Flammula alnicola]